MNVKKAWLVFWVLTLAIAASHAQAQNAWVSVKQDKEPKDNPVRYKWEYSITFKGFKEGDELRIRFKIPEQYSVPIGGDQTVPGKSQPGGFWEWTFKAPAPSGEDKSKTYKMTFAGPVAELKEDGRIEWIANIPGKEDKGSVDGPEPLYDPSFVRPVFGVGLDHLIDDHVDFKQENDHLFTVNDSKYRTTATAGLLLKLHDFQWRSEKKTLDFFASVNFTQDTLKTVDGFVFGLGFGVHKYLEFMVGYSLRRGKELSKGFQLEAARIVKEQQARNNADYSRFRLNSDGSRLADIELYDGFPLFVKGVRGSDPKSRFFPGQPLNDSFNSSLIFGIAVPLDLKGLFKKQ